MHSTRCRRHVSLSLLTHTHTYTCTDAHARTWLTHLGPSHKPVQDIAEILLRCIWKWNSSWRCDTCLPFVLLLGVHKDSRISLCLLAKNKQLIRETARLCLYSINVCLFSFAGSPCNMFSIEQRHIRIWSSDLDIFVCCLPALFAWQPRQLLALMCLSLSLKRIFQMQRDIFKVVFLLLSSAQFINFADHQQPQHTKRFVMQAGA